MITYIHYLGMIFIFLLFSVVGVYSVRYIRNAADFAVGGRKAGSTLVGGFLVGSFIGATSTIGTAQYAYQYGISALWFTLGGGMACLFLGLFLVRPLREREVDTIPQFLAGVYGQPVRAWVALFTSIGMFIQIATQSMAAVPVISSIVPIPAGIAAGLFSLAVIVYIFFGGFWGASIMGLIKLVLIYTVLLVSGLLSYKLLGGYVGIRQAAPDAAWLSMFPGGVAGGLSSAFSVVAGVVSTQTYLQPVFAAKDTGSARRGVLLAGLLIPLAGLASAVIGLYMRGAHPGITAGSALPLFLTLYLSPWAGGAALAILLVSIVLSASALCLGVSTVLVQDLYLRFRPAAGEREILLSSRLMVLLVGGLSLIFVLLNVNTLILQWAFLSMALRGVTVFVPLLGAVFMKGYLNQSAGVIAVAAAPLFALAWSIIFPNTIDPFYMGIIFSGGILLLVSYRERQHYRANY